MAYKNPEDLRAYRAAHRVEAREGARRWRLAHPGVNAAKAREWRAKNPAQAMATRRAYREKNRERIRETQRKWRERTQYNASAKRKRDGNLAGIRAHKLSAEGYQALLHEQGGCCAICKSAAPRRKNAGRLYIDHCHKTNRIRGLLCARCNSVLGFADDSADTLRAAIAYLEQSQSGRPVCGKGRGLLEPGAG